MSDTTTLDKASVNDLTTAELHNLLYEQRRTGNSFRHKLQLIDVRERHEVEANGEIPGSSNIPFSLYENDRETFSAAFQDLAEKHDRVVLYCRSGRRSRIVGEYMVCQQGYKDIHDMLGGLLAWEADNLPIQTYNSGPSPWVSTIFEKDTTIVAK